MTVSASADVRYRRPLVKKLLCVLMVLTVLAGCAPASYAAESTGRLINVIYDDSGSMSAGSRVRWSQAKYAMEVFCAMLGKNDTMRIYPMSLAGQMGLSEDALGKELNGSDPGRVAAVHGMDGYSMDTLFDQLTEPAVENLKADTAHSEKWLVVLTDGEFQKKAGSSGTLEMSHIDSCFEQYAKDGIRVAYLAIGDAAKTAANLPEKGIYSERAADGPEIVEKVTSIANQIFEHLVVPGGHISQNDGTVTVDIDIPTSEIVVFAQGDSVSLGDTAMNGSTLAASETQSVKFSDVKPKREPAAAVDETLKGVVSVFKPAAGGSFDKGSFTVKITGADKVEYYYRPDVDINCGLLYSSGASIKSGDQLYAGDYEAALGFVDKTTGQALSSDLLQNAGFSLKVINNGKEQTFSGQSGTVSLKEGDVRIVAEADFPGNVTLSTTREYKVLPEPFVINLGINPEESERTSAQLGQQSLPVEVTLLDKSGKAYDRNMCRDAQISVDTQDGISWNAVFNEETGVWELRPEQSEALFSSVKPGGYEYTVSAQMTKDGQTGLGTGKFRVNFGEYKGNELKIELSKPSGEIDLLSDPESLTATITCENPYTGEFEPLSDEYWDKAEVSVSSDKNVGWKAEKGSSPGTWIITPGFYAGKPYLTQTGDTRLEFSARIEDDSLKFSGSAGQDVTIKEMDWRDVIMLVLPELIICVAVIAYIIGLLTKKKLKIKHLNPRDYNLQSRQAKPSPVISVKKKPMSVILPYVPQRAEVKCHRSSMHCDFPDLTIEATGGNRFRILNKNINLKTTKIDGNRYESMKELKKKTFSMGGFSITSLDKADREIGKFKFK